ncbi:MAG: class I SAM-dependent methyltransferase, partial [Pseudomonadota bacterium]
DMAAYEEKLARVAGLLRPTDRVLEVGCGTGTTALRLAPGVAHVTGTDISRTMIEIARAKLVAGAPRNVTFAQSAAEAPSEAAPFDAICAFSLLHLTSDLPALLRHLHGLARPGGLFLSKTPCLRESRLPIGWLIRVMRLLGSAPEVRFLSREALIAEITAAGFEIEDVTHFGTARIGPFIVARRPL